MTVFVVIIVILLRTSALHWTEWSAYVTRWTHTHTRKYSHDALFNSITYYNIYSIYYIFQMRETNLTSWQQSSVHSCFCDVLNDSNFCQRQYFGVGFFVCEGLKSDDEPPTGMYRSF